MESMSSGKHQPSQGQKRAPALSNLSWPHRDDDMDSKPVSARVYVGKLGPNITEDDLYNHFSTFGSLVGIKHIAHGNYAFVQYASDVDAKKCVDRSVDATLKGNKLIVSAAKGKSGERSRSEKDNRNGTSLSLRNSGRNTGAGLMGPYPGDVRAPGPIGLQGIGNCHQSGKVHPDFPSNAPRSFQGGEAPNDVEIVVPFKTQREYAEMIEQDLLSMNVRVDMLFPPPGMQTLTLLTDLKARNTKFAIVVTPENEQSKTMTLYVLYGSPEEHRNIDYNDALFFIEKHFGKNSSSRPVGRGVQGSFGRPNTLGSVDACGLIIDVLDACPLTLSDVNRLYKYLGDRQSDLIAQMENKSGGRPSNFNQRPMSSGPSRPLAGSDLRAKIMDLMKIAPSDTGQKRPRFM